MSLVRTSLLNAIAVGIRMLAMLGLNKILAVLVGPAGYALFGQFQNAVTVINTFASGAINTGVTKYTAEFHSDPQAQHALWRTAGTISISCAMLAAIGIALFHVQLAEVVLKDKQFASVFLWLAGSLVLFVLNTLLMAILNGKKEVALYVSANISTSIATLVATWLLAQVWGLSGALIALCINQSVVFFVTLALCWRQAWFKLNFLYGQFDRDLAKKLGAYGLMAMVTAIAVPLSQILIRNHLVDAFGWQATGMWQAVTRMSDVYLMLITTTLTVYYLPRLSELQTRAELMAEISKVSRFILPLTAFGAGLVYLLKDWIVMLLFTQEFNAMKELLAWQLIGDVIKIGSWIFGFVMLGRAMTAAYVWTEIIFAASLVGLTYLFTPHFGLLGSVLAFALNYVLYWICTAVIVSRLKFDHSKNTEPSTAPN
ncbi:O-antigen translocase [Undibacterium cyanobacteriorum]|uniref:O-antigen translocase n=1 Tax=Undibacterium cyanobacteriorum TaxID=3073561 RepID=A0ABY9RF09_9BURK|nr:O-antigen translocase [Undibacterium sp. 20NA77.5]WMW79254.1 O-antigen translocase [Undibacterium sp. 20NA77.5]